MRDQDLIKYVTSAREKFNRASQLIGSDREAMLFMSLGDCILALERLAGLRQPSSILPPAFQQNLVGPPQDRCPHCGGAGSQGTFIWTGSHGGGSNEGYTCTNEFHLKAERRERLHGIPKHWEDRERLER